MFTVYILQSQKIKKFYIGYTEGLDKRLWQHNEEKNKKWTARYRPRKVIHTEEYETRAEAMQREKYLKSLKGGNEWKKILKCFGA